MFSRPRSFQPAQGISAEAAAFRRGGGQQAALVISRELGAGRDGGPILSTDRGACGDPDWEADVAARAGTAAPETAWIKSPKRSATDELR